LQCVILCHVESCCNSGGETDHDLQTVHGAFPCSAVLQWYLAVYWQYTAASKLSTGTSDHTLLDGNYIAESKERKLGRGLG
jgi:hypothetical protein